MPTGVVYTVLTISCFVGVVLLLVLLAVTAFYCHLRLKRHRRKIARDKRVSELEIVDENCEELEIFSEDGGAEPTSETSINPMSPTAAKTNERLEDA
jgi:hypothetical protein